MRRVAGEVGFLVLVAFSVVGAVALRIAGTLTDLREGIVRR